jgi:Holliday junction resolvasome RuvABC endonuclease subunit
VKFLALDQSLSCTGWAVFEDNRLIAADTFTISKTAPMDKRLLDMYKNLTDLYYKYEFEKVYFEDIQLQAGNALTYKHLAYAQAAVILWCGHMDMDWSMSAPSHWRKVLGGGFGRKRAEQKRYAIQLVQKWYDTKVPSDVADAICIGKAAIQENRERKVAFDETSKIDK